MPQFRHVNSLFVLEQPVIRKPKLAALMPNYVCLFIFQSSEVGVTTHVPHALGFYCVSTQSTGTTQLLVFYTPAGVGPTEQSVIQSLAYRIQIPLAVWERHSRQKSWRAFAEIGKSPSHTPQRNSTVLLPALPFASYILCLPHPLSLW